jgi:pyridoxine 5-phosphate synthase
VHLREDRRHIQDRDVELLQRTVKTGLHLEMAATEEMREIALRLRPRMVCLVPEKREELTTEGGLNVQGREEELRDFLAALHQQGIKSSLFIDADPEQIESARDAGTEYIEIHTGHFADASTEKGATQELNRIHRGIELANRFDLKVNLGHGLDYANIHAFSKTAGIREYSIGHSIVARAALTGMERAVRDMAEIVAAFPA